VNALLWDLDDTLLDTLPARLKALSHAYELCLGHKTDPLALFRSARGGTVEDLSKRLMGDRHGKFTAAFWDRYYGGSRQPRLYAGVAEVLDVCHEAGLVMAVVTSKVSWAATEELSQTGLLRYFAAVVGFDDTECHKPDPEPIFSALERILVDDPSTVAFVGDSPADVFAARNAGCKSVAATWGTLDEELLRDAYPDFIAATPHDVLVSLARRAGE
jgi:pyrophosphatase PpaX